MTSANGLDLSGFTAAQQEAIKALIAQEAAKNQPAAPKVLTEAEQAQQHVQLARTALQNDLNIANFNGRVLSILDMLIAKVYAASADTSSAADSSATATVATSATEGTAI